MNDHKYVDITFLNNSVDLQPRPVIFNQYKDSPFIQGDTSDYYMSITRFSINNSTLPVIIPDVLTYETGQVYTGGTIYTKYGINIGIGPSPVNITWSDHNKAVGFTSQIYPNITPVPSYYPKTIQELYSNEYYRISSVQHFLDMLNQQLSSAFYNLQGKVAYATMLANDLPPRFFWNGSKIELLYTDSFGKDAQPYAFIGMNTQLYNLLASFDMLLINRVIDNSPSNPTLYTPTMNYVMGLYNSPNYHRNGYQVSIVVGGVSKSINMNVLQQEVSSVPFWNPVETIFFTTSSLPVTLSANLGTTFTGDNVSNPNVNTTIISDFVYDLTTGTETQGSLSYIATGEYRLFDLEPSIDLKQLTIIAWWKDRYGGNHQIKAPYNSGANMKIMFRKKTFGNN